jgi:hypothetical protein
VGKVILEVGLGLASFFFGVAILLIKFLFGWKD